MGDAASVHRWLLPAVRGERTCSIAITEPEAGSDAAAIRTRAIRDGAGWRLTGQSISSATRDYSDFFVVSAVTDPAARARGISLFLVDKDQPGFTIGRKQPMMGLAGTSHVELFFDDDAARAGMSAGRRRRRAAPGAGNARPRAAGQVGARAIGKATLVTELMAEHAERPPPVRPAASAISS